MTSIKLATPDLAASCLQGALLLGDSDKVKERADDPGVEICQSLPIDLDETSDTVLIQGITTDLKQANPE